MSARAGSTSGVKAVRGSEALVAQVPTVICFLDNMYGMDGRKTQGLEFFFGSLEISNLREISRLCSWMSCEGAHQLEMGP